MAQRGTSALKSCNLSEFLSFQDCIPHLTDYSYVHTFFPRSISRSGSVRAFVNNIYKDTNFTQESVNEAIVNATKNSTNTFFKDVVYTRKYCSYTIYELQATLF